jgi:hypothetical protein
MNVVCSVYSTGFRRENWRFVGLPGEPVAGTSLPYQKMRDAGETPARDT